MFHFFTKAINSQPTRVNYFSESCGKNSRAKNNKKGFTLVELLVVVVILGILGAVAIPLFNNIMGSSKAKMCKTVCQKLESEIRTQVAAGVTHGKKYCPLNDGESGTITVVTNADGDGIADIKFSEPAVLDSSYGAPKEVFKSFFKNKEVPYCPVKNAEITITITATAKEGIIKAEAVCSEHPKK